MDNYDHAVPADLMQCAAVIASGGLRCGDARGDVAEEAVTETAGGCADGNEVKGAS